ncbi:MAG: molybdopterin-dependent oxidoreductase, partial [Actinobacteria bacterium]|nr:molybdopterin-dependent oxidoreductase [Actinomycetota bacterium]
MADSTGSFASRSTQVGGSAIWRCAERVRLGAVKVAADLLEAAPDDLVIARGGFHVAGVPGSGVALAEVAAAAAEAGIELAAEEHYSPGAQTFPYGVHV